MSRSKNAAELCALLVEDTYGELSSRIFTLLLRRGRLTVPALARHTRLPPRHIRHGLAVLVQQNLVYYHFDSDSQLTHYEANQDASYYLLRSGKIMEIAHSRYGAPARDIIQNLLLLGHTTIEHLTKVYESKQNPSEVQVNGNEKSKSMMNGVQNGCDVYAEDFASNEPQNVLFRLLEAGIVEPVVQRMFQSPSDIFNQVENEVLREHFHGAPKGPKQKEELKVRITEKLREIRSEGQSWQRSRGVKRALNGRQFDGDEKRRKLTNGSISLNGGSHAQHSESNRLDRNLVIRINYDKCTVALRNQRLVSLAAHEIGETTSHIYAELLRLLEEMIPRCKLDPAIDNPNDIDEDPAVSTLEFLQALSTSINPSIGIGKVDNGKVDTRLLETSQKKRKRMCDESEAAVEGDASSDEYEDDDNAPDVKHNNIVEVDQDSESDGEDPYVDPLPDAPAVKPPARPSKVTFQDKIPKPTSREDRHNRMMQIKRHLLLLAEHSCHFVRRCGSRGSGEWTVDFDSLVEHMKETELDTIIFQCFGQIGKRIAQILREKGKLEEKQIQKFGLLKLKDVRTKLVEMQMAGFVDIQEVPRDSTRTIPRTMFFWFFDAERVMTLVLETLYKTMSRCFQVLKAEKQKELEVLLLAQRSDIRGYEEESMPAELFKRLRTIREKEEKFLTQLGRLDELVGIFRGF